MGHIVLGAPGIDRFHLHDRLAGSLRARGHRCTVLCTDAAARTFWRHQDPEVADLPPAGDGGAPAAPLAELGKRDDGADGRTIARLAGLLPSVWRWFTAARPDLLLLHQQRSADAALLQFVARAAGCRVLWTGDGLLPHTLQLDEQGLDGDATCCRRTAGEYRVVRGDEALLHACLANALARTTPAGFPRRDPKAPPFAARIADVPRVLRQRGLRAAIASASAWRAARARGPSTRQRHEWSLPATPFVAVLLQPPADPRVRLDGGAAPDAGSLVAAAADAAMALDRALPLVVVAPDGSRPPLRLRPGHAVVPAGAAMDAAATAVATITINHPLAAIALLAGTPVVHTGSALYGVRGVATKATIDTLAPALRDAVAHDHPTLRQRVLTWLFGYGHVWCSGTEPDHNGMLGLVRAIEARLQAPPVDVPVLHYRAGPAWPLAVQRRDA